MPEDINVINASALARLRVMVAEWRKLESLRAEDLALINGLIVALSFFDDEVPVFLEAKPKG